MTTKKSFVCLKKIISLYLLEDHDKNPNKGKSKTRTEKLAILVQLKIRFVKILFLGILGFQTFSGGGETSTI